MYMLQGLYGTRICIMRYFNFKADVYSFGVVVLEIFAGENVMKILRSLTENFKLKVTVITKSKDVDFIHVDELVESLLPYKLDLPKTNKSKSMSLKPVDGDDDNGFDDEFSFTKIAYLAKNFRNFLRNNNRRAKGRNNVESKNFKKNESTKINNVVNSNEKDNHSSRNSVGQQCFGC